MRLCYLLFLFIYSSVFAQDTTYLDNHFRILESKDSLHYYEVIEYDRTDSSKVSKRIFYKTGQLKSDIHYSYNRIDGTLKTFYEDGTLKRNEEYMNGRFIKGVCYNEAGMEVPHFDYSVKPQYPGGTEALLKYIQTGSKKNKWDQAASESGELVVKFSVAPDGRPVDAIVAKGINDEINDQAIKLIYNMPKWKPGQKDGEIIQVRYNLPIRIISSD